MKAKPTRKPGEVTLKLGRRDEPLMAAATAGASGLGFRVKRILVPIDFSECSKQALRYALPMAKERGATLTLLYVVAPVYGVGEYGAVDSTALEARMRSAADQELAKLIEEEVHGEVPALSVVRLGAPASEVVEAARELPADLIVLATHGRTGLKHVLIGSVAEHVVRRAPCPVLVVREPEHASTP